MHGHIDVASELNQGTTFTVQLPLPVHQATDPEIQRFSRQLQDRKVVLVSPPDNPYLPALRQQLTHWGMKVSQHAQFGKAAEAVPEGVDLLVLDANNALVAYGKGLPEPLRTVPCLLLDIPGQVLAAESPVIGDDPAAAGP